MHDNNNKNNSDDTSSPSSTRSSTPEGTVTGTPRVQLFSAGRRPWFDLELPRPPHATRSKVSDANAPALHSRAGQVTAANSGGSPVKASTAFVIGVTGGSASGKTSVAELVIRSLDVPWVTLLCMDSFYKCLTPEESARAYNNDYDFDHPNAFDYDLLLSTLQNLKEGRNVEVPVYCFKTHSRLPATRRVYGANVVIFEGILSLYDERIRALMDLRVFVDTDDDVRLARRLRRDIAERGRDLRGVIQQYNRFVKPSFDEFIRPTMRYADVIVPRGADNVVAVELLSKHIARQLDDRGFSLRSRLLEFSAEAARQAAEGRRELPSNVSVLRATPQLKFIHTMVRDQQTPRDEFIFFADRLVRLVVERGMDELPFVEQSVTTRMGDNYTGLKRSARLCGVSVVRAGVPMERGLRNVCQDITIGKLLIQTDARTLEPQLHYCKLPDDIAARHVLLLDATIATGAAAIMAVRVLLEHGVLEERIVLLTLVATPQGLSAVTMAFPRLRVVTSEVDWEGLDEHYWITPGLGNFGDRYFGTEGTATAVVE